MFMSTTQHLSFEIISMVIVGETPLRPPPHHYMYRYIKNNFQLIYAIFTNRHTKFKQSRIEEIRKTNSYNKMLTQSFIRITAMHIFQRGPKPGAGKEHEKCEISKGDSIFYIHLNQILFPLKIYIYIPKQARRS